MMTTQEIENNRFFRYCLRRYESFGPSYFEAAKLSLISRMTENTGWEPEVFWELFEDLLKNNDWSESQVCAYFEVCSMGELEVEV
jgi:hypothetical protein